MNEGREIRETRREQFVCTSDNMHAICVYELESGVYAAGTSSSLNRRKKAGSSRFRILRGF